MLIWDEKVKPALPLQTARGSRSHRLDKPPLTKSKITLSPSPASTCAHRVKASSKRVINGKTEVITPLQRQNPQPWTAEFKAEIQALFETAVSVGPPPVLELVRT